MPAIKLEKIDDSVVFLKVMECYTVGSYRGEDSGARYPEYEFSPVEWYDLYPILNNEINGRTIQELVNESIKLYPYAGEMFTTPQAEIIYTYIKNLDEISKLKIDTGQNFV